MVTQSLTQNKSRGFFANTSSDEILSAQPGNFFVKEVFFDMHKMTEKRNHIEIQKNFQNMFCFLISFMVYEFMSQYSEYVRLCIIPKKEEKCWPNFMII